jgi:hypothetical protein
MNGKFEDPPPPRRRNRPIDRRAIRLIRGVIAGAEACGEWSFGELDAVAAEYVPLQSAIPTTLSTVERISAATGIPEAKIRESFRGETEDADFVCGFVVSAMRCWQSCWEECKPAT